MNCAYIALAYKVKMNSFCSVLLALSCLLPAVLGAGHLSCNPATQVCPILNDILSISGFGMCNHDTASSIRTMVTAETRTNLEGYISGDNEYFNEVRDRYLGQTRQTSADSCAQILENFPNSQSGYYWVGTIRTYCDFNVQTPSSQRAWERIANLDMSNMDESCPSSFYLVKPPETRGRYCVKRRDIVSDGCQAHAYLVGASEISRVYGRVYGIQVGSGDGFIAGRALDEAYLDGIKIRASTGEHVWSFVNFAVEAEAGCPCSAGSTVEVPSFVGNDYFCESGTLDTDFSTGERPVFENDLLWDGQQCGGLEIPCCTGTINGTSIASPPWFYKEFESPISASSLNLQICTNQELLDEDVGLYLAELYVQ